MDFFKQRARQILIEQVTTDQLPYGNNSIDSAEMAYEGKPLCLKICYQQLKNLIKRPAVSYSASTQEKPGYMKMTFAMSRSVAPNSKILQMSSMVGSIKHLKKNESSFDQAGNYKSD